MDDGPASPRIMRYRLGYPVKILKRVTEDDGSRSGGGTRIQTFIRWRPNPLGDWFWEYHVSHHWEASRGAGLPGTSGYAIAPLSSRRVRALRWGRRRQVGA